MYRKSVEPRLAPTTLAPSDAKEFALIATAQLSLQRAIMRGTTLPAASIIYDVRALAALEMRAVNASPSQSPVKKRKTTPVAASPPSLRTSAASRVAQAPSPIGAKLVERYNVDAFKAQCSRPHMEA